MKNSNKYLPEAMRSKYETKGFPAGSRASFPAFSHCGKAHGMVDLKTMDEAYAERLIKAGFPYLQRKKTKGGTSSGTA